MVRAEAPHYSAYSLDKQEMSVLHALFNEYVLFTQMPAFLQVL